MKVLKEFINVYVSEEVCGLLSWLRKDGFMILCYLVIVCGCMGAIVFVGLYSVGLFAGVWVVNRKILNTVLLMFLFSLVIDLISIIYVRLRLMYRHTRLPINKEELQKSGFDLCNYVLYLKYSSHVKLDVFNYILLFLGFPLNIFLYCKRLLAKINEDFSCDFDILFEPEIFEVHGTYFDKALSLINEVYGASINIEDIREELYMRTYEGLKLLHGGVNNRFIKVE